MYNPQNGRNIDTISWIANFSVAGIPNRSSSKPIRYKRNMPMMTNMVDILNCENLSELFIIIKTIVPATPTDMAGIKRTPPSRGILLIL